MDKSTILYILIMLMCSVSIILIGFLIYFAIQIIFHLISRPKKNKHKLSKLIKSYRRNN